jgi:hypothetical protein
VEAVEDVVPHDVPGRAPSEMFRHQRVGGLDDRVVDDEVAARAAAGVDPVGDALADCRVRRLFRITPFRPPSMLIADPPRRRL